MVHWAVGSCIMGVMNETNRKGIYMKVKLYRNRPIKNHPDAIWWGFRRLDRIRLTFLGPIILWWEP
jgi:hypothetical protein